MMDGCRSNLIYFNTDLVKEMRGQFTIVEIDPDGAGSAIFNSNTACILIKSKNSAPLIWSLAQRKCADGAFITFDREGAHLHIVELKSKLGLKTWAHVLQQFEGMYLTCLAVSRLLNIGELNSITCYVATTSINIDNQVQTSASPVLIKTPVGRAKTLGGYEEWKKNIVKLPYNSTAKLIKGSRGTDGNCDFGRI